MSVALCTGGSRALCAKAGDAFVGSADKGTSGAEDGTSGAEDGTSETTTAGASTTSSALTRSDVIGRLPTLTATGPTGTGVSPPSRAMPTP